MHQLHRLCDPTPTNVLSIEHTLLHYTMCLAIGHEYYGKQSVSFPPCMVHFWVLLVHPGWIEHHMGVAKLYTHFRVCKAK
jgi:hypothetical protein